MKNNWKPKNVNSTFTHVKRKGMAEMVNKKQQFMRSTMVFKSVISSWQNQADNHQTHAYNTYYIQHTLHLIDPHLAGIRFNKPNFGTRLFLKHSHFCYYACFVNETWL